MTPDRRKRKRGIVRVTSVLLLIAVASFAVLEVAARGLTHESGNGMPCFGRVPLLPFRPTAEIIEQHLARNAASTYIVHDADLGWSIGPDGEGTLVDGAPLYRSNHQGVRADPERVYDADAPPGKVRIVTVGDSFTHCDEVDNAQTWQHDLEANRPELEVLNLGVPGYGTDQALMRWRRDGRRFRAQLVILGIWPENMCRNLSVCRYYLVPAESFACKPRMVVQDDTLQVIDSPVIAGDELIATLTQPGAHALLAHDYWYRESETRAKPFEALRIFRIAESAFALYERKQERAQLYSGANPAGIDITVAIAEEFTREVRAAGSTPLVLLIPMRDLLDVHTGSAPFPLVKALREHGVEVLDLGPTFGRAIKERGAAAFYGGQGHHSPEGNRLLADALATELRPWLEDGQR